MIPMTTGIDIKTSNEEESTQNSPPMDSAWPMYCHDARHTCQSQFNSDDNPGIEKWRYRLCREFGRSCPVIDGNGIIYVGTNRGVYSLFSNGTLIWSRDLWGGVSATIAIDKNGILYIPTTNSNPSYFYALDLNGTILWKYQHEWQNPDSSPAIAEDGTIYFGDESGYLYALNPDGTLKWRNKLDDYISSSPAIDNDGNIYCMSWKHFDKYLYAFSPDGKRKWKKDDVRQDSDVSIDDNDTIYYISWNELYAVNADGSIIWNTPVRSGTTPSISDDGVIYIGYENSIPGENITLKAFNSENGKFLWLFNPGNKDYLYISTPAISAEGILYFVTIIGEEFLYGYRQVGGEIISLNPDGTERWRELITDNCVLTIPTIGEDGTVYVVSNRIDDDGCYIHAFGYPGPIPTPPTIDGPLSGKPDTPYTYSFKSVEPDGDDVSYYIDWGDGNITNWTDFKPSREPYYEIHSWASRETYIIRAKAKDTDGYESDWGELQVTMPRDKSTDNMLLLRILERFPLLQKLLFSL
jgi:hypothetical protein